MEPTSTSPFVNIVDGLNDSTPSGSRQTGGDMFDRYTCLFDDGVAPFVRSAGDQRVVDSALNWTTGFGDASGGTVLPTVQVALQENVSSRASR